MEEAKIKCLVHGSSLRGDSPLVMVTTRLGEKVIYPVRDILIVEDRIQGSRVFKCRLRGKILQDKGETVVVRIKSDEGDTELEVPKEEIVYSA